MKRRLSMFLAVGLVVIGGGFLVVGVSGPTRAGAAATTYGTLDNFDVVNDTGVETHGFEIELEGISLSDVVYEFGAPYQRYGDPTKISTGTGVIIRYAAAYDSGAHTWSATTPLVGALDPATLGHACWTMGSADYWTSGCEHFGASLNAQPTKTTYRWLVESSTTPGSLTPFGSNVPLPAPVWNVTPPAVPAAQPVVAAVIAPPDPAPGAMWGEAMWAKVYVHELPEAVNPEDLNAMVKDGVLVPDESEVEFEWVLMQARAGGGGEQEFGGAAEVGAGNEVVSRRFEFYKYEGLYDAEGEALCDNPIDPVQIESGRCGAGIGGLAVSVVAAGADSFGARVAAAPVVGVGGMIGAQNVAININAGFAGPAALTAFGTTPPAASTSQTAAFTWSAPVVTRFLCSLDAAPYAPCSSPRTYRSLAAGPHELCVQAVADLVPVCWAWSIVSPGPPVATITGVTVTLRSARVTFTADQLAPRFTCSIDLAPYRTCSSPLTYNGLALGSHTVRVLATNFAGDTSALPAVQAFSVS